jgi:hypothetical protein
MASKGGLSEAEHRQFGLEIAKMRDRLVSISTRIGNAYPVKSKQLRLITRAIAELGKLRCEMDEVIFREKILPPDDAIRVYYPDRESRQK